MPLLLCNRTKIVSVSPLAVPPPALTELTGSHALPDADLNLN
jgi:hypothetical protein